MTNKALIHLIKSLTKSEKRYFKIHSSVNKTNQSLVELFNLIEKGKTDHRHLIKALKLNSKTNLSVLETRLHQLIMKHLRGFHSNNTINIELKNLLIEIEILYNKRLFKNCGKTILRAKKIAKKYDQHLSLLELLKWESYLEKEEGKYLFKSQEKLKTINTEEEEIVNDYLHLSESRYHTFNLLLLSKNKIVEQLNKELSYYEKLFKDNKFIINENYSLEERVYILNFRAMYFMTKGDYKNCLNEYNKLTNIIENSDRKNILKSNEYFLALNNNLLLQVMNNHFDEYEKILNKIYAQFSSLPGYEKLLFNVTKCYELAIYCELAEVNKGLELIPEIVKSLKSFGNDVNEINRLYFYLNIAILYIYAKNYSKSIYWLNVFLNDYAIKKNDVSSNLFYYAHLINLLTHFEAENYDSIEYLYKESKRNLQKIRKINAFDSLILKFIFDYATKLPNSKKEKLERFKLLKKELKEISTDKSQTTALQFFDFFVWIESHLLDKSIIELIKSKRLN